MLNFNDTVTMKTITLKKLKVGISYALGKDIIDSMQFDEYNDALTNNIIHRLEFEVLSNKIVDDKYTFQLEFKYPATWFQYLKQDKFPKWFIKKYPVRYKTETRKKSAKFSRYAIYPKSNLDIKNDRELYIKLGSYETFRDVIEEDATW